MNFLSRECRRGKRVAEQEEGSECTSIKFAADIIHSWPATKVERKPPSITQLSSCLRVANKEGMMFLDLNFLPLHTGALDIGGSSFEDIIDIAGIEIGVFIDCPFI